MPHLRIALKILGILLTLFSGPLLLPLGVSWLYDDGVLVVFKDTFLDQLQAKRRAVRPKF